MIDAKRAQLGVLASRRRADDAGADVFRDLRRSDADAAAHGMDQNRLAALQTTHHDNEQPGGQVIDRNGGGFQRRHFARTRKNLVERDTDGVRITAKACHGEDIAADPNRFHARAYRVNPSGHFVTRHDRHRRQVRINSEPTHDVGEVDAARFDSNAHLARFRHAGRALP